MTPPLRILALDLGLRTGVCLSVGSEIERSHAVVVEDRCRAIRYLLWRRVIRAEIERARPDVIAYERVRHIGGGPIAAHTWGGLEALLLAEAAERRIPYLAVSTAEMRRAARLPSSAGKDEVLAATYAQWPDLLRGITHDEADARWVAVVAAARLRPSAGRRKRNQEIPLASPYT